MFKIVFYTPENGGIGAKMKLLPPQGLRYQRFSYAHIWAYDHIWAYENCRYLSPSKCQQFYFCFYTPIFRGVEHDCVQNNLLFDPVFFKIEISRFWLFFAWSRKLKIKMQSAGCCQSPINVKIGNFAYLTKPHHQKKGRIFSQYFEESRGNWCTLLCMDITVNLFV